MAAPTSHVIKKDTLAAEGARSPDPSLLSGALRIPETHVRVNRDDSDSKAAVSLKRLLHRDRTAVADKPYAVSTDETASTRRGRAASQGTKEHEPTPEEIEAEWQRRLEREVAEARADAFAEGQEAARSELEEEVRQSVRRMAGELDAIAQAKEEYFHEAGVRLVQLAFRIARTILDAPLPDGLRRVSETAIADAIDQMAEGIAIDVSVHPVSYLRLQESGLEDQLSTVYGKLRWKSDPDLKENEWVVQSDRAAIRRLEAELIDQLQRELSLRDLPREPEGDVSMDEYVENDPGTDDQGSAGTDAGSDLRSGDADNPGAGDAGSAPATDDEVPG